MVVKCDKCHIEFEICTQTEKIKNDIEMIYFVCPSCGEKYKCFITNLKIRNKQDQVRKLRCELEKTNSIGQRVKLEKKITHLRQEITKEHILLSKQHKNIW